MERIRLDLGQDVIAGQVEEARADGRVLALLPVAPSPSPTWREAFNRLAEREGPPLAMIPPPAHPHGDKILLNFDGHGREQVLAKLDRVVELMIKADAEANSPPDTTTADAVREWWEGRRAKR